MIPLEFEELVSGYPKGTWVAISEAQNRIMASGSDVDRVVDEARERGEAAPLILRVPETSTMLFFSNVNG